MKGAFGALKAIEAVVLAAMEINKDDYKKGVKAFIKKIGTSYRASRKYFLK